MEKIEQKFSLEHTPLLTENGDNILVMIRSGEVYVNWELKNTIYSGKELSMVLICSPIAVEADFVPYTTRINLLSSSARTGLSRELKDAFKKIEVNWTLMLNQLCTKVESHLAGAQSFDDLLEVEEDTSEYLLEPFIAENSANMLFGRGGTGKSYLSLAIALSIATGEPFLDYRPVKKKKVLFVDYESTKNIFARRLKRVAPLFSSKGLLYYYGMTAPLIEQIDSLRTQIKERDIGFVIVDSAALAAGGRPEDAENALKFFSAIKRLNTTTLVIAHETKQENKSYPFGSVFFFNNLRNIWNASSQQDDLGSDVLNLGLFHRKSNEDKLMPPRGVRIYFGKDGIEISKGSTNYWEQEQTMASRVLSLLREGAKKQSEIVKELESNKGTISKVIHKLEAKNIVEKESEKWHIKDQKNNPLFDEKSSEKIPF